MRLLLIVTSLFLLHGLSKQTALGEQSATSATGKGERVLLPFDYRGVTLESGVLQKQYLEVRDYYMALPNDNILHQFRKRAGLSAPGKKLGGGPHGGGSVDKLGQWLSGLSRFYASTGDIQIRDKVNTLIDGWEECIEDDGYFFATRPVNAIPYRYDKAVCGLVDAYLYCGNGKALSCLRRITDWAIKNLDRKRDYNDFFTAEGLEWYTLSENLYRAYLATNDERYRDFAGVWEYTEYWDLFAKKKDIFKRMPFDSRHTFKDGRGWYHSYSHVNTLSSAAAAYLVKGERRYLDTVLNAYDFLHDTQVLATGAYGPEERTLPGELLVRSLTLFTNHAETQCGTWAGFKLSKYLTTFMGKAHYGDWVERLAYNSIGASIPMSKDGHVYYHAGYSLWGFAKKNISFPWACCSGTRPQAASDFVDLIYFHTPNDLHVNLFTPSTLRWQRSGQEILVRQMTEFPLSDRTELTISPERPTRFAIKIRVPQWLASPIVATVNDKPVELSVDEPTGWAHIEREWVDGDRLELTLPRKLWLSRLDTLKRDGFPAAILYGPVVLAATSTVPGNGYHGSLNPSSLIDFENLETTLEPVPGKPLHFRLARLPQVTFRPFHEIPEGEPYYVYLDPDLENRFIAGHGVVLGRGPKIKRSAGWTDMALYFQADKKGEHYTLDFRGSGIRWVGNRYEDAGKARVEIDGKVVAVVDQYGPGRDTPFLWQHTKLAYGDHTITVTVLGEKCSESSGTQVNLSWLEAIGGGTVNLNLLPEPVWTAEASDSESSPKPKDVEMVLWLRADSRVQVRGDKVTGWEDHAGGDNNAFRKTQYGAGIAELTQAEFPVGKRPVIHFDGDTGFGIENEDALDLENFTVLSVHTAGPEGCVIANSSNGPESGWILANDGQGENGWLTPYWFNGIPYDRMWGPRLEQGFHVLSATYDQSVGKAIKTIRVNGAEAARKEVDGGPLTYAAHATTSVGSLRGQNWFRGSIAEIIVLKTADPEKRDTVERYLQSKYGLR